MKMMKKNPMNWKTDMDIFSLVNDLFSSDHHFSGENSFQSEHEFVFDNAILWNHFSFGVYVYVWT